MYEMGVEPVAVAGTDKHFRIVHWISIYKYGVQKFSCYKYITYVRQKVEVIFKMKTNPKGKSNILFIPFYHYSTLSLIIRT